MPDGSRDILCQMCDDEIDVGTSKSCGDELIFLNAKVCSCSDAKRPVYFTDADCGEYGNMRYTCKSVKEGGKAVHVYVSCSCFSGYLIHETCCRSSQAMNHAVSEHSETRADHEQSA